MKTNTMKSDNILNLLSSVSISDSNRNEKETTIFRAAFPKIGEEASSLFVDTILKLSEIPFSEWEETEESLLSRKEEIINFLNGNIPEFHFDDKIYSFTPFILDNGIDNPKDVNSFEGKFPSVFMQMDESGEESIALFSDMANCHDAYYDIPVIIPGANPGLMFDLYLPFKIKDKQFYMLTPTGEVCGGPFRYFEWLQGNNYFVVDGSTSYIVDFLGEKISEEGIKLAHEADRHNGYTPIFKDGKWGFVYGDRVSPVKFDDITIPAVGEILQVKLGDEWGYVDYDTFDFISEQQMEEDDYCIFGDGD